MPNQNIDIVGISASIQILKRQREAAMDDVADLMGRLESRNAQYAELEAKYNALVNGNEVPKTPAASDPQTTEETGSSVV